MKCATGLFLLFSVAVFANTDALWLHHKSAPLEGAHLEYQTIQSDYDRAFKKIRLSYCGTHVMRLGAVGSTIMNVISRWTSSFSGVQISNPLWSTQKEMPLR